MKNSFVLIGLLGMGLIVGGCVTSGSSRVEDDFGNSFRRAKANQTLNPEAAKNIEPVTGLDGKAAQGILDRYQKDFEKQAPPAPYVLSLEDMGKK
jgi:hypothetical protein